MGYQPRMRGRSRRFGRPTTKKSGSRQRREDQTTSVFYEEPEQVNPSELSMKVTNAIKHLGDQRFALPPYAEHFQRWLKDVQGILTEFETKLAGAVDQQYRDSAQKALIEVQEGLNKRIEDEKQTAGSFSNIQQQLTAIEIELSKLEGEYNKQNREIKRKHEDASGELQREIYKLGKQRLSLLRKKSNLLDRIFKRSEAKLEEKTSSLQSKKNALGDKETQFKKQLEKSRTDHEIKRKYLLKEQNALRAKLADQRGDTQDDALEIRKRACDALQQTVTEAVNRFQNPTA